MFHLRLADVLEELELSALCSTSVGLEPDLSKD